MYIETPFNYTGSKFKLLEQILPHFDYTKQNFVDVFMGGGSVYSNVLDKFDKVYANDIISDLVNIHKELFESDDIIIKTKEICVKKDDQEGFLKLRSDYNQNKSSEKLWALMLCSTNNMMRFNKKFLYNQTFGKRTWNTNTDKKVIEFTNHVRQYKNKIKFKSTHFKNIPVIENTFYYLDPPYLETEAGYNCYYESQDDKDLYEYIHKINENGSTFMISGVIGEHKNGKRSLLIDKLIADGFNYKILDYDYEKVARNKNSKNSNEIIIFNYGK